MELLNAVVLALACTTMFVLATHHMMDHTFVKSAIQVNLTLILFVIYHILVVIEVFVFECWKLVISYVS